MAVTQATGSRPLPFLGASTESSFRPVVEIVYRHEGQNSQSEELELSQDVVDGS